MGGVAPAVYSGRLLSATTASRPPHATRRTWPSARRSRHRSALRWPTKPIAALVALLVIYHWHCGRLLKTFQSGGNAKSHVWFRFYNEMPVLVLFAVVFLVVLKPF